MIALINSRIAKELGISKVTVGKYIEDSVNRKNNLQTDKINEKVRLIDSPHNWLELKKLVDEGRKYRPNHTQKNYIVGMEFYKLFDKESQFEIIRDLEIIKQIDLKYYYHNQGAQMWDSEERAELSLISQEIPELLQDVLPLLSKYFQDQAFNLIDIGAGNGMPADIIMRNLEVENYIACDISPDILKICEKNIKKLLPDQNVVTTSFDFQRVSLETRFNLWNNALLNLFTLAGNTICNYSKHDRYFILNSITRAMDREDLFLVTYTLDTDRNKTSFSYVSNVIKYWLPQMLGIDTRKVETESKYTEINKRKALNMVLDKSYNLNFDLDGQKKQVHLNQGEKINIWQHYLFSLEDLLAELKEAGLHISFVNSTQDNVLVGCKLAIK